MNIVRTPLRPLIQINKEFTCILLSALFLCTYFAGRTQAFLKATLYDQPGKQPISFATVKVLHKPFGAITNDKGNFEVEALSSDTLLITSIGFVTKKILAFSTDTIFLQPAVKELTPVVVSQKHLISTYTSGIKAKISFQWSPSGYAEEFAQKINLNLDDNKYGQIMKVMLSIKRFSAEVPALLHLYSVDSATGLPSDELLSRNYFISKENYKKGKITIDISSEKLYVDEKCIFVSFGWLGGGKRNNAKTSMNINMTNEIAQTFTYSRTVVHSSFNWFPVPKKNGKTTNTIFQIEIDEY